MSGLQHFSCPCLPGTSITGAGCCAFFFQCGRIKCSSSHSASTLPAKLSHQSTSGLLISLSQPHDGTLASAFSLTFKVINNFNHFSLQPSQRPVQFSGGSHGPAQLPAVPLDSPRCTQPSEAAFQLPLVLCYFPASSHNTVTLAVAGSHFILSWPLHITCAIPASGLCAS